MAQSPEDEKVDSPYERLKWFYDQRRFPFDTLKQGYLLNAYHTAKDIHKGRSPSSAALLSWQQIGPAPLIDQYVSSTIWSGRVAAVAVHPSNASIVYVGAADGGVWKTTDGGLSYLPLTDDQPTEATGSLAIDPSDPSVIYWGTGEPYYSQDSYGGVGLMKSTDGGLTWVLSGLSSVKRIRRIAIDPLSPNNILAATSSGLYRSADAGLTWSRTSTFTTDAWDVAFDPSNGSIAYAGASGMYKSVDGGLTWTALSNGIPTSTPRLVLAVAPSNPSIVCVLVSNTTFYKSTDAGASWISLPIPSDLFSGQGWYDIAIGIDPTNANTILIGGVYLRRSIDGGTTWTSTTNAGHTDTHALVFGPTGSATVYRGHDGGVSKSTDNGSSWTYVNGNLAITQFYSVATNYLRPNDFWGGAQDNGTSQGPTTGLAWKIRFGGDGMIVNIDYTNPDISYGENENGKHFRIIGEQRDLINTGITEGGSWVTPVVMHPDTPTVLYTATSKVYRTTNMGTLWSLTAGSFPWGASLVRQLGILKTPSQTLYASPGSTLYRSTDAGATWGNISTGLPGRIITSIVPHPTVSSRLYVTVSGSGTGHIFTSTDAGSNWTSINGNFPADLPVNSIAIDPSNDLNLYIGTDLGMWSSADGGTTWLKDEGVPNSAVVMLGVTSDNYLVAATHGRSMFKAPLSSGPFLTLTSPNGGESWFAGSVHNITWSQNGIANVKIEYSTNNGIAWTTIIASTPASAGSYAWTIPNSPTSQALVRVSDTSNAALNDVSSAPFTISPPASITLTAPNGGESWNVLSSHAITWTSTGVANTKLEYSTNNGSTWATIIGSTSASAGTYAWTVPNTPTTQALVRASDASNAATNDASNSVFTIAATPAIAVISPNGGEVWPAGTIHNIVWSATLVGVAKLEYSTNNGSSWSTISAGLPAVQGTYAWTVPNTQSSQALVRISDSAYASINDVSNAVFGIAPPPSVTVISPNGGESWNVLSSHAITWSSISVNFVKIELSTNGGSSWSIVSNATSASTGSYTWSVPNSPTLQARIRLSDTSNAAVNDVSDSLFSILSAPAVTVNAPNGGENWSAGSIQSVSWTSVNITNVKLEYSTDNGTTWASIVASTPAAAGTYSWSVPNAPTTRARVRASDAGNAAINDMSDGSFTISVPNSIVVTSPNGGEVWNVSSVHSITWTASGANNVRLRYSTNNGSTWNTIISSTPGSAGSYSWTIPNTPSTQARVQVSTPNGSLSDMSDTVFTISAGNSVTLLTPNGGEKWYIGTSQLITWSSFGISNVALEYSTNAGSTWSAITPSTPAAAGSYAWTVPSAPTLQALVRVSDASNALTNDVANSPFTIAPYPSITVVSPNGGELFAGESQVALLWSSLSVDLVKLEYSTDNGFNWLLIDNGVASSPATYLWNVPSVATNAGLVRVSDAAGLAEDRSDAPFTISAIQFRVPLIFTANTSLRDTLTMAAANAATDGIDLPLGESELTPQPGESIFDTRWEIVGTNGTTLDIRDTLGAGHSEAVYTVNCRPGTGGYPCIVAWGTLPHGVWELRDALTHGGQFNTIMKSQGTFTISDTSRRRFEIRHTQGEDISMSIAAGWNMISMPVTPTDWSVAALFPNATSRAFAYAGGFYQTRDTLDRHHGYWLKFAFPDSAVLNGSPIFTDTVDISAGWNLVGSVAHPASVAGVQTIPPAILTSQFYGYQGIYSISDSLRPAHGYWIKSSQAGKLLLGFAGGLTPAMLNSGTPSALAFSTLQFEDAARTTVSLWFGEAESGETSDGVLGELPPVPPAEMFDVRFSDSRSVHTFDPSHYATGRCAISVQSSTYPVTIRWELRGSGTLRYQLTDSVSPGEVSTVDLQSRTSYIAAKPSHLILEAFTGNTMVPAEFGLSQNFPNPFNPTTEIPFAIRQASRVRLAIYDILGREVSTLVSENLQPGVYRRSWNPQHSQVSSGVYTYRIEASPLDGSPRFISSKRMILMK